MFFSMAEGRLSICISFDVTFFVVRGILKTGISKLYATKDIKAGTKIINYIGKIIVPIYVLTLIIFFIIQPTKHIVFKLSLIFLILIAAGSPLTRWDAWAIWLFHAKRIFIEENFFITLNNYTNLHNDYPLMMPSFAVSFAQFLNGWNIIFPKISIFFLYMPPLIYSLKIFDKVIVAAAENLNKNYLPQILTNFQIKQL